MIYQNYIPKGIPVTEDEKRESSFLYATHRHDLFYIAVTYMIIFQKVFKLQSGHKMPSEQSRGNKSESMKA